MKYLLIIFNETGQGIKWGQKLFLFDELPNIQTMLQENNLHFYELFERAIGGYELISCNS
ncbi:MAG: hypothetical protein AB1695_12520 [Stygiobacter sp.]